MPSFLVFEKSTVTFDKIKTFIFEFHTKIGFPTHKTRKPLVVPDIIHKQRLVINQNSESSVYSGCQIQSFLNLKV